MTTTALLVLSAAPYCAKIFVPWNSLPASLVNAAFVGTGPPVSMPVSFSSEILQAKVIIILRSYSRLSSVTLHNLQAGNK